MSTARGFSAEGLANIEALMQRYVAEGKSAGMLTLVHRHGETGQLACHGHADIASQRPVTPDTIFRIYSMTKPITSAALMTLWEQGRFGLDDPARRWIPALGKLEVHGQGALASDITVRQLLTHTAGFSYGFDPENIEIDREYARIWRQRLQDRSMAELLPELLQIPLLYQPGERWHYSIATDICGHLVEILSDMPLADYLQQTLFDPLGMADTGFEVGADKLDRFATLYGFREDDPLAQLETLETSPFTSAVSGTPVRMHSGGGGLTSTATDYLRFAKLMLGGGELDGYRLLQTDTVALMTRNHLDPALLPLSFNGVARGPFTGYGFGLGYAVTIDTAATAAAGSEGDFGWGGLADTYCWVDPARDLVAILMQQYMPSLHHPGRREFRDCVYAALSDEN